jgi:predicted nucleotidyltransferase component of viral defense system
VISRAHITAWRAVAPWSTDAQVEQDLILSRALVQIFSESTLNSHLAFRGGTVLHKLFLNPASRYSEDIDLVQVKPEPIGPTLTALHKILDSWLGEPRRKQSEGRATLIYRFDSEIAPITPLRLKVEINTREHFSVFGYVRKKFKVKSPWFNGETELVTYSIEELLGTKLRALYQRKQGRDLFDLAVSFEKVPKLDAKKVVSCFLKYIEHDGASISRAEFESNLLEKLADPVFTEDISPLLVLGEHPSSALHPQNAGRIVMDKLIALIPGEAWKGGN